MSDKAIEVIADAMWHALDSEQGAPHCGVDMTYVAADFLSRLKDAGIAVVELPEPNDGKSWFIDDVATVSAYAEPGDGTGVQVEGVGDDLTVCRGEARDFAAALLAAAAAAEAVES